MGAFPALLAVAWWAPLAIVGGAVGGAVVGYVLLAVTGAARTGEPGRSAGRLGFERAESTADLRWNPAAFLVVGGIVALIVGLSIGLTFD